MYDLKSRELELSHSLKGTYIKVSQIQYLEGKYAIPYTDDGVFKLHILDGPTIDLNELLEISNESMPTFK